MVERDREPAGMIGGSTPSRRADLRISAGEDISRDGALHKRAEQLAQPRVRRGLAGNLRNLLEAAREDPWVRRRFEPPLQCDVVLGAQEELERLVGVLLSEVPLSPRALATATLLVLDRDSPIYTPHPPQSIDALVAQIIEGTTPQP